LADEIVRWCERHAQPQRLSVLKKRGGREGQKKSARALMDRQPCSGGSGSLDRKRGREPATTAVEEQKETKKPKTDNQPHAQAVVDSSKRKRESFDIVRPKGPPAWEVKELAAKACLQHKEEGYQKARREME